MVHRHVLLDLVPADQLADLAAEVVGRDEDAVAERAEAEEVEPFAQAIPLPSPPLGQ